MASIRFIYRRGLDECSLRIRFSYKELDKVFFVEADTRVKVDKTYWIKYHRARNVTHPIYSDIKKEVSKKLRELKKLVLKEFTKVEVYTKQSLEAIIEPEQGSYVTPEAGIYIFSTIAANTSVISQQLLNSFDSNDLRKQHWLKKTDINGQTYYGVYKYKNKSNNTDENSILFRIEHAYAVLAESLLNQGKLSQATEITNKIRTKRGLLPLDTNISKQELQQAFLLEMYKEFFTEIGHRFYTLKRLNKLNQLKESKPNWKEYNSLFPVPEKQLLINSNLNPQNNGY